MIRDPFVLADGCTMPYLSLPFDLTGLPFCDIPSITTPTSVVDAFPLFPELPMPGCPCIPTFLGTWAMRPTLATNAARGRVRLFNNAPDCCEPEIQLDFSMTLPCMPGALGVQARLLGQEPGTCAADQVGELFQAPRATFAGHMEMRDGCELHLDMELVSPCMPFTLVPTVVVSTADTRRDGPSVRAFANMRASECVVEVGMNLALPPAACPKTVVGRKRVFFAGSQLIANYVDVAQADGVYSHAVSDHTGVTLTRMHTQVTRLCTQPGGDVIARVGVMAYNTYAPVVRAVTRLSYTPGLGLAYPLVGRLTVPVREFCGARGTNYLGLDMELTLPIIPCLNIPVRAQTVEILESATVPRFDISFGRNRGALFTCSAAMSLHLEWPHMRLSGTALPVAYGDYDPGVSVWWSRIREFHRRLNVRFRFVDGLTECFDFVADVLPFADRLEKVMERACFRRGVLYTVYELERSTIISITDC